MTGDMVVWRGLTWVKQAASRAPPGGLHGTGNQRLVNFHHATGSARVSKSAVILPAAEWGRVSPTCNPDTFSVCFCHHHLINKSDQSCEEDDDGIEDRIREGFN